MNCVNIIGKVIEPVNKATSSSNVNYSKVRIGVEKINKDGTGNGYDNFEVIFFRDLSDIKFKVGQILAISGRLMANNYEKEDKQYYNAQIIGTSVSIIG